MQPNQGDVHQAANHYRALSEEEMTTEDCENNVEDECDGASA